MQSFIEFNEALTTAQRLKAKATFRKNKAKIMKGKEKAAKRLATPDQLAKRAEKAARKALEKKILKDRSKNDLSFSERENLEKKLDKKKAAIKKLAKKLLPKIKIADKEKLNKGEE